MTDEAQSPTPESPTTTHFYYSIAEFNILLESGMRTEIIEQREIFPIPHAPEWCLGMISLRGKLIPVINTHRILGCSVETDSHWLLIVESEPLPPAAIRIDRLPAQYQLQAEQLQVNHTDANAFWLPHLITDSEMTVYQANHGELFQLLTLQNQPKYSASLQEPSIMSADSPGNDV